MSKTEVIILGTLHGLHKDNKFYDYEDVFKLIDCYNPDLLGVEIRQEDIEQPREYLKRSYPYEMIETKFRYENKYKLYGFDYYEKSIEGKLIPEDYFDNMEKIKLEKAFEEDSKFTKEKKLLEVIDNVRINLLVNRTADEINDGKYDVACKIYYNQLEILYKGTNYEALTKFYRERDLQIQKNMIKIINENIGKKIMFITGCDHRGFALDAIKETFNDDVKIIEIVKI